MNRREPHTGVVERQEVEQERSRERLVIFCVVRFVAQIRGEFAGVQLQTARTNREDVRAEGLPHMPVHIRAGFVCRTPLKGFCSLAELKIDASAITAMRANIGRRIDDESDLLKAERVCARVIGPQ